MSGALCPARKSLINRIRHLNTSAPGALSSPNHEAHHAEFAGTIAGIVIGSVTGLLLIGWALWCRFRSRDQRVQDDTRKAVRMVENMQRSSERLYVADLGHSRTSTPGSTSTSPEGGRPRRGAHVLHISAPSAMGQPSEIFFSLPPPPASSDTSQGHSASNRPVEGQNSNQIGSDASLPKRQRSTPAGLQAQVSAEEEILKYGLSPSGVQFTTTPHTAAAAARDAPPGGEDDALTSVIALIHGREPFFEPERETDAGPFPAGADHGVDLPGSLPPAYERIIRSSD